jgi:F-type H+-transporting ATPase subunit b
VHAPQPPHALPEEPASALPSPSPAEPNHAAAGSPEPLPAGHDVPGHGEHGAGTEHGGPGHEANAGGEHGGHGAAHEDHNAPPHAMNWFYGFLGTDDKVEPNLLWRKPDMPPPFLANLINFALFAYVIVRFGKKPLQEALTSRKKAIMQDIDAATKMLDDATKRLNQYEDKLRHIDQEIERIKKDFREQGERDKERILAEAKDKRERMLKDAQFLIEQEAKQLRIDLIRETVDAAVQAAEQILVQKITSADHDRIAEDYLKQLASSRGLGVSKGGSA